MASIFWIFYLFHFYNYKYIRCDHVTCQTQFNKISNLLFRSTNTRRAGNMKSLHSWMRSSSEQLRFVKVSSIRYRFLRMMTPTTFISTLQMNPMNKMLVHSTVKEIVYIVINKMYLCTWNSVLLITIINISKLFFLTSLKFCRTIS